MKKCESPLDVKSPFALCDIISLFNVYSHLPDPPAAFSEYREMLSDNGLFLLQTGDVADLDSKSHYWPFSLPDHLSFASERIVVNILTKLGFEIVCVKKYPLIKGRISMLRFAKEVIKILLPNKESHLRSILMPKKYSHADMYILARKKSKI